MIKEEEEMVEVEEEEEEVVTGEAVLKEDAVFSHETGGGWKSGVQLSKRHDLIGCHQECRDQSSGSVSDTQRMGNY